MLPYQTFLPLAALACLASTIHAQDPAMMKGFDWRTDTIFTIGSTVGGFTPTGTPDGLGAYPGQNGRVWLYANSELPQGAGYPYALANGTMLTGARITRYEVERIGKRGVVASAGLAFDTIYDRQGNLVTAAAQINETGLNIEGLSRLCSAVAVTNGNHSFVDDIFFTGEEASIALHPHGGTVWALDVATDTLWAVPRAGRGAWENVTPLDTGNPQTIALMLGSDDAGAPLYIYVGTKNALGNQTFLDRNGLAVGQLYYWATDNNDTTPEQFHGHGSTRSGKFQAIAVQNVAMANAPGHDAQGYRNVDTLRNAATQGNAFRFSRLEDLHVNPMNGTQVVLASSGLAALFPSDTWGTTYIVDVNFTGANPTAVLRIVADSDELPDPDAGIRSPDNVTWASDGFCYVQEDRATVLFGNSSGRDASIWQLDPVNGDTMRIAEMNRTVLLPPNSVDIVPGLLGSWESSGIIDVTNLFATDPGEVLLLAAVQPHGVVSTTIWNANLSESGQLLFLSNRGLDHAIECSAIAPSLGTIDIEITGGTANGGYAVVFTLLNAGQAPNGWFFGINTTMLELGLIAPPLVGVLDATGNHTISLPIPCPLNLALDAVVVELDALGLPTTSSPAVTHRL